MLFVRNQSGIKQTKGVTEILRA